MEPGSGGPATVGRISFTGNASWGYNSDAAEGSFDLEAGQNVLTVTVPMTGRLYIRIGGTLHIQQSNIPREHDVLDQLPLTVSGEITSSFTCS